MNLSDPDKWQQVVDNNTDSYGRPAIDKGAARKAGIETALSGKIVDSGL